MIEKPFPHAVIDNFIPEKIVSAINKEWPEIMNKTEKSTSIKNHSNQLPPAAKSLVKKLFSKDFIVLLEDLTGISGLIPDKKLRGGGLHEIQRGGFLKMHVDFNKLPNELYRRVNLLIYLNEDWRPEWGGQLQLGKGGELSIEPTAGRAVIFLTSEESWHGHPHPLLCPPNRARRSLALYYYTKERPDWFTEKHTTIYI